LGARERRWRSAVNYAAVVRRRVLPAPRLPEHPAYPKLFVVGCPRSGTSWVQAIITAQPRVISSSESHAYETIFENTVNRAGSRIDAWTKVLHRHDLSEREARWVGLHWWVNRATLLDLIGWALHQGEADRAEVAERVIQGVFDSYFFEMGGDPQHVLLEKTPGHLNDSARILRRYPDARVIEVVRDGRDVCVSLQMQGLTAAWPPKDRRGQIELWVRSMQRGAALHADPALADRVLRVRYEDMKADPPAQIARLLAFAGLDAGAAEIATTAELTDFGRHQNTGAGSHTRKGSVGDWRNHFTPDDEALFRELATAEFEAAGYRFD
jgi:hypothetical protein